MLFDLPREGALGMQGIICQHTARQLESLEQRAQRADRIVFGLNGLLVQHGSAVHPIHAQQMNRLLFGPGGSAGAASRFAIHNQVSERLSLLWLRASLGGKELGEEVVERSGRDLSEDIAVGIATRQAIPPDRQHPAEPALAQAEPMGGSAAGRLPAEFGKGEQGEQQG